MVGKERYQLKTVLRLVAETTCFPHSNGDHVPLLVNAVHSPIPATGVVAIVLRLRISNARKVKSAIW